MLKNWLKYFISFVVIVFIGLISYFFFDQSQSAPVPVLRAVPENALLVAEFQQGTTFWGKLRSETTFWPVLANIDEIGRFQERLFQLDSLLLEVPGMAENIRDRQIGFSLHPTEKGFGFLFVAEVRNDLAFHQIQRMINSRFKGSITVLTREHNQQETALIVDPQNDEQYAFVLENGLFIGSFHRELVEQAVAQMASKRSLADNPDFKRLMQTRGTSVDGYVYVQNDLFELLISHSANGAYQNLTKQTFQQFGSWSMLDLLVKDQDILLNGYTMASDSTDFLAHLHGLKATDNTMVNMLPYSTRLMLHFGMEDFQEFWERSANPQRISAFDAKYRVNSASDFIPYLSGELSIAYIDNDQEPILVAGLRNEAGVEAFLNKLASRVGGKRITRMENAQVVKMNPTNFPGEIFGSAFSKIKGSYYLITDQYLLVADDVSMLEQTLHMYRTGRTLDMNENFKGFQDNMADQANVSLYVNLRDGLPLLNQFVSKQLNFQIHRNKQKLSEFEGLAVQLTAFNDIIYTNVFLKHNPNYKEESLIAWKTALDAPMVGKPHIVEDHITSNYNLLVFDAVNNMYLIDPEGKIRWKKKLAEEHIGEVFVVDYYKNGKYQFLFNSANYLYLIDRNGNNVSGYPIKLRSQATNGIVVFDYNDRKDYRILVSCADKLTYNYELNGKQVDGWQKPRSLEIVTKQVERLIAAGKDYIIITDIKGNVRIVDRRGQVRISPRGNLEKSVFADFYVNKTNSKGILLTSDKQGKLLYVSGNGQLSTTDFGQFTDEHFFLYEDFNQDGSVDFIYLDGNKMKIFDRFKKTLFSYDFKNVIVTKPRFFNITKRKRLLGVVSEASREIYLIDKNGKMIISSGLAGETPFAVGSLRDSDEINLITGLGEYVYNYVIY